ncbi:MAG: hypothetical protein ACR2PX_06060 [Endozoicomonas sp.]|uniref:hypothetical protein n=1 Tax=Endozoicomonas sp. TaxID=1892382 RepID=UPI003D9ACF13
MAVDRAAMEIAYQCNLSGNDLLEEGIYIKRAKGSIPEITLWNRRLKAAVGMALKANVEAGIKSAYLFPDKDGSRLTEEKLSNRFKDKMRRRVASGK